MFFATDGAFLEFREGGGGRGEGGQKKTLSFLIFHLCLGHMEVRDISLVCPYHVLLPYIGHSYAGSSSIPHNLCKASNQCPLQTDLHLCIIYWQARTVL